MEHSDPMKRFRTALSRAQDLEAFDATRAALATADADGRPSVRFVLVKEIDDGGFCFYTNFESRKARDLDDNPRAALCFHWHTIGEQVRVEGSVERLPQERSESYFRTRPRGSQIGAWASPQSRVIDDREELERTVDAIAEEHAGKPVPLPPFWGGYRLRPETIEFWLDRADRLHDRFLYTRIDDGYRIERLAP